jgi:hypothetical protein
MRGTKKQPLYFSQYKPQQQIHMKDIYRKGQWTRRNEADVGGLEVMVTNLKKMGTNYYEEMHRT